MSCSSSCSSSSSSSPKSISPRSSLSLSPKTASLSLPADLIFNILSRLPINSLCKFKSVSKLWLSIITDPFFISTHKKRSLKTPNLLILEKKNDSEDNFGIKMLSLGLDGKPTFEFEVFVNKPIELLPSKWEFLCFLGESGFYVCNPSTKLFVKMPEPSCCTSGDLNAGIGFVEETNEYVLIHLFDRCMDLSSDCDFGCEIMRFKDGFRVSDCIWEVVNASCPFVVRGWGVLVKNVFYWMIWDAYDQPGDEAILLFDLENNEFGTVSPPEGSFDPKSAWFLVELNGSLCLVDNEANPFTMEIWVLKDSEKHEWAKQYSIDLTGVDDGLLKLITPLDQRDGKILMDSNRESLDCYDLENKTFKRKENFVKGEWTWLRIYIESFFSLKTI